MRTPARRLALWLVAAAGVAVAGVAAAGCASPAATTTTRPATRAALEARVAADPSDAEALRDLGLRLALDGDHAAARVMLTRAVEARPADGAALFGLGLAAEAMGDGDAAEATYARYTQITGAWRDSLRGRHDAALRRRFRVAAAAALAADTLGPSTGSAVGVLPFAYRGTDAQYAALGRGLAEVLSADLANVAGLTVVERVRQDALLAESALARAGALDAATAPRTGAMLQADRLVGGEVHVDGSALRLDAAVWDPTPAELADTTAEGALDDLFAMQRTLTRGVFTALGIDLTPDQASRLADPPTDDLTAFLLFSRGLMEEDGGFYRRAADLYRQALARDPSFSLAGTRLGEATLAAAAARPPAAALVAVTPTVEVAAAAGSDVVDARADALAAQLQPFLLPDTRDPLVDANQAGLLGPLPDPPPPPASPAP